MNAADCNARAAHCAANAELAGTEVVASEFLKLAAQWRAMAVRDIFLGVAADLADTPLALSAIPRPLPI
ncbi:MAG TPA: hypothetical protein VKU90_12055 [Caulobacteraceae bacterium]|nr:hypothetical protein [Caulobacteraceae bacterium]